MSGAPENGKFNLLHLVLILAVGWFGHSLYLHSVRSSNAQVKTIREDDNNYQFTNPFLYNDNSQIAFPKLDPLKDKFASYINPLIDSGEIVDASVYFRKLGQGEWTGVNEDHKYLPVSLLKVADLIVYLRNSEDDSKILKRTLHYSPQDNRGLNYPPKSELVEGDYEVAQLLRQDIIESDNAAHMALSAPIEKDLENLYRTLRFPEIPPKAEDWVTPEDISTFYRTLYGSTYLTSTNSEYALKLLSQTDFDRGLVAGVTGDVKISHKFGEFTVYHLDPDVPPDYQLHDCGIIYYPDHPYFLCVMTKGNDLTKLERTIQDLSAITFEYVSKNY